MNIIEAIIFGTIQGAAEFLPISSSGHLALAHYFLGAQASDLAFDVALHLGTLLAMLALATLASALVARKTVHKPVVEALAHV